MVFAYTIAKYCFNESQNCFYSTHLKYISPAAYGITSYFLVLDWLPPSPTIHALLNPYSYKNTKSGRQTDSQVSVNYLCLCFPKVWAKTFLYLSLIYLKSQILDHHGSSQMVRRRTNHFFKLKKTKAGCILMILCTCLPWFQRISAVGQQTQRSSPMTEVVSRQVPWSVSCLGTGRCYRWCETVIIL